VVVWATDWISGVVLLLTLPIVLLFMVLAGLSAQRRTNDRWRALERMSNHFLDVAEGLTTLRVFGRARAQRQAVQSVTHEYRRTTMTVLRASFLSSFVLELFASLSVAIVAVQVGLRLIGGSIELEAALIVLLLAPEAFQPLRTLGASYHAAAEGRSATANAQRRGVRRRAGCHRPPGRHFARCLCSNIFRVAQERGRSAGGPQRLREVDTAERDARLPRAVRRHSTD
jgi:ABC-type transport system involved in cytochrome bd biosynthesis fused ATPase/permease subunit